MANKDASFGLRLYSAGNGSALANMQNKYRIASGYSTAIFQGDLVAVVTAGGIERVAAGGSGLILGVFNGCRYTDPTSGKETFSNHYPGSISASTGVVIEMSFFPMYLKSLRNKPLFSLK